MYQKQHTIKKAISVSGVGLHTGQDVTMTFKPADVNFGFKFQRVDLEGKPLVKADISKVVDVSRGTTIEDNGVRVNTVEHTLAALAGLEIDNVLIELNSAQPPIMDGSSKMYVDALLKAGLKEQDAPRKFFPLHEKIVYREPERKVEIIAIPSDTFRITVMVDYNSTVLGTQHATVNNMSEFKDEIADARTFCFLHEIEELVSKDLIRGGDLNNAIVVVDRVIEDKEIEYLASLFNKPKINIHKEGILNDVKLHHQNEPARHKLLDVVGDLALIGYPLQAHIIASRPGHKANVEFAKMIKEYITQHGSVNGLPNYKPTEEPIFDINKIKQLLPHRYPFLLVDKVIELTDHHVVGVKNVTVNEPFFKGHFPGNPVMPGVLQLEAMAQTGGIFVLNSVEDPENYDTYFLKIEKARFKYKVIPGDTLLIKMELLSPIRRGICEMKGTCYVGNRVVTEANLMARISRKNK